MRDLAEWNALPFSRTTGWPSGAASLRRDRLDQIAPVGRRRSARRGRERIDREDIDGTSRAAAAP